jgi:zinc protease
MLVKATVTTSYEQLQKNIDDYGLTLYGFSGKDSLGIKLNVLDEFVDNGLALFRECFFEPEFPNEQWENYKKEILEDIRTQEDSLASLCIRKFQEVLYGDHPYRNSILGTKASVEQMTESKLMAEFVKRRDGMPWVFSCVSSMPPEKMAEIFKKIIAGWNPKGTAVKFSAFESYKPSATKKVEIYKDREQVHLVFGFPGLTWFDKDRPVADVISTILGGQGGRLFLNLRDRQSLAYAVSPLASFGVHPGMMGAYIACAPAKLEVARAELMKEFKNLIDTLPSAEELARAKNYLIGGHEEELQRGDAQAMTMALMELYGVGYDDFLRYPTAIAEVTAADIQRVAKTLFVETKLFCSEVGPIKENKS